MPKSVEVEHGEHVGHAQWSGGVTGSRPHEHLDNRLANVIRGLFEIVFLVLREQHRISLVTVERVRLTGLRHAICAPTAAARLVMAASSWSDA